MKTKSSEKDSKKKNTILFLIFDIVAVICGLYGAFVSLTGGMGYINSPDIRTVEADVVSVDIRYEKDDNGYDKGEWIAYLSYTVDGREYTAKKKFLTKVYSGETVDIEVYKAPNGEYKMSDPNVLGVIVSVAVLIIGITGLISENKERNKKKAKKAMQNVKKAAEKIPEQKKKP